MTICIKSSEGWCLVKIEYSPEITLKGHNYLAVDRAKEIGCCPEGTRLIYSVVDQDDSLYNKLFSYVEVPDMVRIAR